jgi:hypothetical protein
MKKFGTGSSKTFFGKSDKTNPKKRSNSIYVSKQSRKVSAAAAPQPIIDHKMVN